MGANNQSYLKITVLLTILLLITTVTGSCDLSCPNCPCFARQLYTFSIPDNLQVGSEIAQLTASPPHGSTPHHLLTYAISAATGPADFTIDSASGSITSTAPLDYHTMPFYNFTVQASDGSNNTGGASVSINVLDSATLGTMLVCAELVAQGEVLEGEVNVSTPLPKCFNSDGSVALSSDLTYSITSGNPNSLFQITLTASLLNTAPLDYESQTSHTLILSVSNSESLPQTNTLSSVIEVMPVNEFPPIFTSDLFTVQVSESTRFGTSVGRIAANDSDGGRDGVVTYSLLHPSAAEDVIFIHPDTGSIILINTLDFESTQVYNYSITAVDSPRNASSQLSATATLSITVLDANDNSPVFTRAVYFAQVRENSNPGTVLSTTPSCDDQDTGVNSAVTYSILNGNNGTRFAIDATFGVMSLLSTVDYDAPSAIRLYTLTLECRETQPPRATAESLMIIEITSYNDFRPDPGDRYMVTVREDMLPGSQILQVEGRDRDYGPAGTLRYFLNMGSQPTCPDNLFMDVNTGIVYLMAAFDYETGSPTYHCTVTVFDSELPQGIAQQDILIFVQDVNDAEPSCDLLVHGVTVREDEPVGYQVLALNCADRDSPNLQYSFAGNQSAGSMEKFQLSQQGTLTLRQRLDFESQSLYILNIMVSDGRYSVNTTVYVTVTGFNEYPPVFANMPLCTVPENSVPGTSVCIIQATDADSGEDGDVWFDIQFPLSSAEFEIDPSTGLLYVIGDLDKENASQQVVPLTIRTSDNGSPSRYAEITVNITIADTNDNTPHMETHTFQSIAENSPSGSSVTTLHCTDSDEAGTVNSIVRLQLISAMEERADGSLLPANPPPFSLNDTTGEMQTTESLDFETTRVYHLSVVCRDQGSPSRATFSVAHISVSPVNEYRPEFSQILYEVTVPEETALGTTILNLTASDRDSGSDGDILYSFDGMPPGDLFWIDPQVGVVGLIGQLQCDVETRHSFRVLARDRGIPQLESSAEVIVNVNQCHLGQLTSSSSVYAGNVVENSPAGTPVLRVECVSSRMMLLPPTASSPSYEMSEPSSVFQVDATSGEISVLSPPDYETARSHLVPLRCYDPNHRGIFDDMVALITVTPVNEHQAIFDGQLYTINVPENTELGTRLATVTAVDADWGRDGEILYSIDNSSFVLIDEHSGDVFLTEGLDREAADTLMVTVTARDNPADDSQSLSASADITINVLDVNDNWPVCAKTVFTVYISPALTETPTVIFNNSGCVDADIGSNSQLYYSLGSDEDIMDMFSLNSTTGELTLLQTLDPEDVIAYRIPVVVSDSGDPPFSSTFLLILDLEVPLLEGTVGGGRDQGEEFASQVEAEGLRNTVNIILEDVSLPIWEGSMDAKESFGEAIAHSVTSHCAIFPEACSLLAGCSQFFGVTVGSSSVQRRSVRSTTAAADESSNYANFIQLDVVLLPNSTTEIRTPAMPTTSLQLQFYVKLPDDANRSPTRTTNYVVPRSTLGHIVEQDRETIGAVVRSSVSPPLTVSLLDSWQVVGGVSLAVISLGVLFCVSVAVCYGVKKYKEMGRNRVMPIKKSKGKKKFSTSSSSKEDLKKEKKTSSPHSLLPAPATNSSSTVPRTSLSTLAHIFITSSRSPEEPLPPGAALDASNNSSNSSNRTAVTSKQSTRSSSDGTDVSMENHASRDGSHSSRRVSSDFDQSHDFRGNGGLVLEDCDEEGEDPLGEFPMSKPRNPVKTNGLSLWKNNWR